MIKVRAKIIPHGRLTAALRTQITDRNNRRVMKTFTAHEQRAG